MNSACALSGVGTMHMPCALYRHIDKDSSGSSLAAISVEAVLAA
jgi:hypothetical protein